MTKNKNTNPNKDRISIAEARHAIGMTHRNYSDAQIKSIIDIMLNAAEFAFERYDETSQLSSWKYNTASVRNLGNFQRLEKLIVL